MTDKMRLTCPWMAASGYLDATRYIFRSRTTIEMPLIRN